MRDGDVALLVDLGDGSLIDRLPDLGIKRVEWVLSIDHHREGCQGMARVDRKLTKVAVSKNEQEIFEKPTSFRKWFPKLDDKYSVYGASYVRPHPKAIAIEKALTDGEVFQWRGWKVRCLNTPGHSPGGMSYLIHRDGKTAAITGGVIHNGAKMVNWFDSEWNYGFAKGLDALIASVEN